MSTFGVTTTDGTAEAPGANYKQVSKFTLSENGSVTKLSFYMLGAGASTNVRGFIYDDSSGPNARKAIGSEFSVPDGGGAAWYDSNISPAVNLAPGSYWLGFFGDSAALRYYQHNVTNNRKYKGETYSSTPSDPFGSVEGTDNLEVTVYATYDAIAPTTTFKRFYGPAQLGSSAADLYTVPASTVARVMGIHASNPSGSPVDLTLSIGADGAATRVYDGYALGADGVLDDHSPYELAAGEKIQGFASSAATVNLTITGWEKPA